MQEISWSHSNVRSQALKELRRIQAWSQSGDLLILTSWSQLKPEIKRPQDLTLVYLWSDFWDWDTSYQPCMLNYVYTTLVLSCLTSLLVVRKLIISLNEWGRRVSFTSWSDCSKWGLFRNRCHIDQYHDRHTCGSISWDIHVCIYYIFVE